MADPQTLERQVEAVRVDQRARWARGERPRAEVLLEGYTDLLADPTRALQVVYQEVLLRERAGEVPALAEYLERFPQFAEQLPPLFAVHEALEAECGQHTCELDGNTDIVELPKVPGYELFGVLGRGGMGVVYKALRTSLNRLVALKMIRAGPHADARDLARFRAEAQALASLQHPNIVQVYEVGTSDGRPYLALEYVEGGSLAERLTGRPQAALPTAELVETLARAIHYAHQRGLIHRDLKPANVLLRARPDRQGGVAAERLLNLGLSSANLEVWTPKITDFGLVKLLRTESDQTQSGDVIGTPSYVSPEQAAGRRQAVGPAADTYSLGAILYELLTGRPPFLADTALNTLLLVKTQEPAAPRRLVPEVPRDLEAICLKCLRKDPGQRYADAAALADDLRRFRVGAPVLARPIHWGERAWRWCRRQPVRAGVLTTVALAGLAALVSLLTALMVLVAAGYAVLIGLWLRAEWRREEAENLYVQAETHVARFQHRQTQADLHLLEAAQRQGQAEARARQLEDDRRRTERTLRETKEAERRQFFLLEYRLAWAMLQLGNAHCELGRFEEAADCYRQAAAGWDKILAGQPHCVGPRSFLGVTWNNLGEALRQLERHEEAIEAYHHAIEHQQGALAGAEDQSLLGRHYLNLARVCAELGRHPEARAAMEEGLRLQGAMEVPELVPV